VAVIGVAVVSRRPHFEQLEREGRSFTESEWFNMRGMSSTRPRGGPTRSRQQRWGGAYGANPIARGPAINAG
jgi:hypothetical protein